MAELGSFVGRWEGKWRGRRKIKIIIWKVFFGKLGRIMKYSVGWKNK
jgi:hypothetical protein